MNVRLRNIAIPAARRLRQTVVDAGRSWRSILLVAATYAGCAGGVGLFVYGCEIAVTPTTGTVVSVPGLSVSPAAVAAAQSAVLTWTIPATYTACSAGNAWAGSTVVSGTALATTGGTTTLALTATGIYKYIMTCKDSVGASEQFSTLFNVYALPTLSFDHNPITLGQSATLTWTSSNATSCTAGGAWAGASVVPLAGGTLGVTPTAAGSLIYSFTCVEQVDPLNEPLSAVATPVTLVVNSTTPPNAPTVAVTISPSSIPADGSIPATLSWTSANATACVASGSWTGPEQVGGAMPISPTPTVAGAYPYTLTCTGPGGSANSTAVLTVNALPTVTITVSPTSIVAGSTPAMLSWTTANSTSCSASGSWSGTEPASGTLSVSPATPGPYTYTLTCTGLGGTSSASAALTVTAAGVPIAISNPNALAVYNGNLYVANSGSGNVLVYSRNASGVMVQQPSLNLSAGLVTPVRLAFDGIGDLFVSDIGNNSVVVFDAYGNSLPNATISVQRPVGVAVDTQGVVYVGENTANAVAVFSYPAPVTGGAAPVAGPVWTGDSTGLTFSAPGSVAFNGTDILVAIASNVVAFYTPASLQQTSGALAEAQPSITSSISGPTGIAFDFSNDIYVTNYYSGAVTEYSPTGAPIALTLTGTPSPAIATPEGVAIDMSGNIYVSNAPNNVIYVYNAQGVYQYALQ